MSETSEAISNVAFAIDNLPGGDSDLADALRDSLMSPRGDEGNLTSIIEGGCKQIARALDRLGNADAATPMGALEAHGKCLLDAAERVADALSDVASALERIADGMVK